MTGTNAYEPFPHATQNRAVLALHHLARWTQEDYFAWGRRVTSLDQQKLQVFFSQKSESSYLDSQSIAVYESYLLCALRIATWATVAIPALGALVLLADEIAWNYNLIKFDNDNQPKFVLLFDVATDTTMDCQGRPGSRHDYYMHYFRSMQRALFDKELPITTSPKLILRDINPKLGFESNSMLKNAFVFGESKEVDEVYYNKKKCDGVSVYFAHLRPFGYLDKTSRLFFEHVISTQL